MRSPRMLIGIAIFAVIAAIGLFYQFGMRGKPIVTAQHTLKGYFGGEKAGFLADDEVRRIMKRRYGITLDAVKAGSIEMVRDTNCHRGDFLWPSSQVAMELFRLKYPGRDVKTDIVFNSPIVLYSWDVVADALMKQGIVRKMKDTYFVIDLPRLIRFISDGRTWASIGLPDLYGRINIIPTDPTKSNSGNMFTGLLANILAGDVVTLATLPSVKPSVTAFIRRLGYLEHSSGDLFEQYLRTGMGAKPLIVGYESQIVEFSLAHRELWPKVKSRVAILYPEPTVWSSHPLIALTANGKRLIEALTDKDIQRIAWERHGFRTGLMGVENDPRVLDIAGIPEAITKVMPMPSPAVMESIITSLEKN